MDKYIRVKNCNCISDATIEIVEKGIQPRGIPCFTKSKT